jgi:hypothetical protein
VQDKDPTISYFTAIYLRLEKFIPSIPKGKLKKKTKLFSFFHITTTIDVKEYEKQDSLLIIDSARAYFGSSIDTVSFVKSLVNYADQIGKNGVTVLADTGSFFCYNKLNDLIEYETSLHRTSDMKAKGFCLYKRDDFKCRISHIQRKKLLDHHGRELMIAATPTIK